MRPLVPFAVRSPVHNLCTTRDGAAAWRAYGPLTADWIPVPQPEPQRSLADRIDPPPHTLLLAQAQVLRLAQPRRAGFEPDQPAAAAAAAARRAAPPPIPGAFRRYTRPAGSGDPDWMVVWYWAGAEPVPGGTGDAPLVTLARGAASWVCLSTAFPLHCHCPFTAFP